ncbi:hypothetical protein D3C80_1848970 [compost metagenome]
MAAGGRGFGLLNVRQYPSAVIQITLPGFGQVHTARGSRQQLRANACFHRRHRPGHTGRRQPQPSGSRRETLVLGNRNEHLHFLKAVHGMSSA